MSYDQPETSYEGWGAEPQEDEWSQGDHGASNEAGSKFQWGSIVLRRCRCKSHPLQFVLGQGRLVMGVQGAAVGDWSLRGGSPFRTLKTHGDINLIGRPVICIEGRLVGPAAHRAVLIASESHIALFVGLGAFTGILKEKPQAADRVWAIEDIMAVKVTNPYYSEAFEERHWPTYRLHVEPGHPQCVTVVHGSNERFDFVPKDVVEGAQTANHFYKILGDGMPKI